MKMRKFVFILLSMFVFSAHSARVEFSATLGSNIATGSFEWNVADPIFSTNGNISGDGKILWSISGAIGLNGTVLPMTDNIVLEVMNNWSIDGGLIGDQITLFGLAAPGSGLRSVQNFYFRDETGLLLDSIAQPTSQADFDQFTDIRVDLFLESTLSVESFTLTKWQVTTPIPLPSSIWLFLSGVVALFSGYKITKHEISTS